MQLILRDDLPFVELTVIYKGYTIEIPSVLVDTGSASTILAADQVTVINIFPEPEDRLFTIRGVGGSEVVYSRRVDRLQIGMSGLNNLEIEVGGMDYGFEIGGILGMDFLTQAGAVIDLRQMTIEFST